MRTRKTIKAFGLILALGLGLDGFAQEIGFPSEVKGYELYGRGKLTGIALKTSTRADVKLAFGDDCDWTYCKYDDKWDVMLIYLEDYWRKSKISGEFEYTLLLFPEFVDRLWIMQFRPKESVPFTNISFSSEFLKESGTMVHSGTNVLYYRAASGLVYTLLDEGEDTGRLLNIDYGVPEKAQDEVFFVVEKRNRKDNEH